MNATLPHWICLTGFMGSGKSTVGAFLAEILGRPFVDLDAEIAKHEGRSIAEIFRDDGEARFRQVEGEALQRVLQTDAPPAVIALGGGTFVQPANRERLHSKAAVTIYLEADFELLRARCCTEEGVRPLMQDAKRFHQLFEQRRPVYCSAEIIVQVADRSPQELAAEIATAVEKWKVRTAVSD